LEVSPELKEQGIYKMMHLVYKTGRPFVATEQMFYISKDLNTSPEVTYLNFSIQPIYNKEKRISGVVMFGYDVTELVESREKSEENVRMILESLPQITSISSSMGTNIYFNNFFYEYSGISREEASKNGWNEILHPEEKENLINEWEECKRDERDFYKELRLKRKADGMYRWHIVNLTPVKNKLHKVIQWIASATDIHEQKTKEEKKDEFLSIASHELKTPLTTVKAYLQLLEFSLAENDPELKMFAKKAIVSVDRLRDLISELLDVSKIQQQKLNLNIGIFDFDELLKELVSNAEFKLEMHKIKLSGDTIHNLQGDRERLAQVINNLISNAIKYSPNGNAIDINLQEKEGNLNFSVSDKGIGILPGNLEKIFERYFRVEGSDIHFQGLGIGLFISMEIIRRHGGKMWVESQIGEGSTFHFSIPMERDKNKLVK
jgi:PAS domain S-box-containing protein